jgi:hypothetical protein
LAVETLEVRTLLASLTSRLPPIVITPGSEPVEIRQVANPSEVTTLPSAAVSAIRELASTRDIFSDQLFKRDDSSLLAELEQEIWSPLVAILDDESLESLDFDAAMEIATTGFEVLSPPPEVAVGRIFGPPLSETPPSAPTSNGSNAAVGEHETPLKASGGSADTSATLTTNLATDTKLGANPKADEPSDLEPADEIDFEQGTRSTSTSEPESVSPRTRGAAEGQSIAPVVEAIGEPTVIDEAEHQKRDDRQSSTDNMLLLRQPTSETPESTTKTANRSDTESPILVSSDEPTADHAEQATLGQMLLLAMVPDSGMDHESARPIVIAGFNPVAMLQIFVGVKGSSVPNEEFEVAAASSVDEADVDSTPMISSERLIVGTFVIVVGYWYFHWREDETLATRFASAVRDRRPRRWARLLKYFARR